MYQNIILPFLSSRTSKAYLAHKVPGLVFKEILGLVTLFSMILKHWLWLVYYIARKLKFIGLKTWGEISNNWREVEGFRRCKLKKGSK